MRWNENNGIPTSPNLGENWLEVHRSHLPSRLDRPKCPIPNLIVYHISISDFEKYHFKYRGEPFGCLDFETWRDFTNPNMATFLFYRGITKGKDRIVKRVGMKPVMVGGKIPTKNGRPLYWEDDKSRWKTDEKGEKIKPKTYGKEKTDEHTHVEVAVGWLWDDEVADHWPKLCRQMNCERVYAHNATVDIIALLHLLKPDLAHPLLHFTSSNKDDKSNILFKGSNILQCKIDLSPHIPEGHNPSRHKWNHKEKEAQETTEWMVEFRDSIALMPLPLGALGGAIGYPKTGTPEIFTNANHPDFENYQAITPEMIRYAVDDCIILWKSMLGFWNMIKELGYHGKSLTLTIGSLGFQMIAHANAKAGHHITKKRKRSWKYETIHNRPDLDNILRESLIGGCVRVLCDDIIKEPSFGIDARALYPSVEHTNDRWPDFTKLRVVKAVKGFTLDWVIEQEGGVHVEWIRPDSDSLGRVATRCPKTGNLIWTEKSGTRWLNMADARYLLSKGYTLNPVPFVYERTIVRENEAGVAEEGGTEAITVYAITCPRLKFNPFEEVKRWYDKRIEMKNNKDPRQILIKLLMNAGSFGKWVEMNQDIKIADEMTWCYEFADWEFSAVREYDGEMIGYVKNPIKKRASNSAHILGSYITSYGRHALFNMADAIGFENLLYCDTDSWKVKGVLDEVIPKIGHGLMGRDLGQWAVENEMDYFQALKPKQYKCHFISTEDSSTGGLKECDIWKLRIKGVNVRGVILHAWRQEFETGQPTDDFTKRMLKELKLSDKMVYDRLIGIRESFRSEADAGVWVSQSKQFRGKVS